MEKRTMFGLAFDIVRDRAQKSGFAPAETDLGSGKNLFGLARLEGFAAIAKLGFASKLVIIGGNEGRYRSVDPPINRARAITEMLVYDYDVDQELVMHIASNSNTGGNIAAIRDYLASPQVKDPIVVSNHYHLPRISLDLAVAGIFLRLYPAESFILLQDKSRKGEVIRLLGGGPLAERVAEEIQGIDDKWAGVYQPRTDSKAS